MWKINKKIILVYIFFLISFIFFSSVPRIITSTSCPPDSCQTLFDLVYALYGKECDSPEYDPVADVNKDKKIDIRDISSVSSHCGDGDWCQGRLDNTTDPCVTATVPVVISSFSITCNSCENCTNKLDGSYDTVILDTSIFNHTGTCITFNADDIVFDCNGNTIDGTDSYYDGIYVSNRRNITVRNCTITDWDYGIYMDSASNNTIANNDVSSNDEGIWVYDSSYNRITNNTIMNSTSSFGIVIESSNYNSIASNDVSLNDFGIFLLNSSYNSITNNIINSNIEGLALKYFSYSNSVDENEVCFNSEYDFYLEDSYDNSGYNNTCDRPDGWNDTDKTGCTYTCPPKPEIINPLNGSMVNDTIVIEAIETMNATDVVLVVFEYLADDMWWLEIANDTNGSDGWSVTWDTSEVFDRNYHIRVNMIDIEEHHGYDTIEVYVNNEVPEPYITEPSNDGFIYNNVTLEGVIYDNISEVTAIDMNLDEDVVSTLFEYSSDGLYWTTIGLDEDGSYDCEDVNCVGRGGWDIEWDISGLGEGIYYIKATMTDIGGQSGEYQRQVHLDPTPPIPTVYEPSFKEVISGMVQFKMNTSDEDVTYIQLGYQNDLSDYSPEINAYFYPEPDVPLFENRAQEGLGTERQEKVGPSTYEGKDQFGRKKFSNNYCSPTAAKNALWRLAQIDKRLLKIPKDKKKQEELMKCFKEHMKKYNEFIKKHPGYAEQEGLEKHKLKDYNNSENFTNLGLAVILACKMKTDPKTGTTSIDIVKGIENYLKELGLEKKYTVSPSVITTKRDIKATGDGSIEQSYRGFWIRKWDVKNWEIGQLISEYGSNKGGNKGYYEKQLQKGEAVIVSVVEVNNGTDNKWGTPDDQDIRGTEHTLAGMDYGYRWELGADGVCRAVPEYSFIDNGTIVYGGFKQVKGTVGGVYKEFVEIWLGDGKVRRIRGIIIVSPTKECKKELGKNPEFIPIIAGGGSSEWVIDWDTTSVSDGYRLIEAMLVDASGNVGKDYIMVIVDNNPPNTTKTIGEPKYWNGTVWFVEPSTPFTLTVNDSIGSGVNRTYYRIWYNGSWSDWTVYNESFTLSDVGVHRLQYYSVDNAGHVEGIHEEIDVVTGLTSPNITILSPENITYITNSVYLIFTIDEPTSWIGYSLDGQPNVTITGNRLIYGLTGGSHHVTVYANDTYGNMGSETVYFTTPYLKIIAPTNGATYSERYFYLINEVYISYTSKAYRLDTGSWVTFSGNPKIYSYYGNHTIRMRVISASKTYYSDTISFTLKRRSGGGGGWWLR